MEHNQQAYEQAARVLPIRLRQEALSLPLRTGGGRRSCGSGADSP